LLEQQLPQKCLDQERPLLAQLFLVLVLQRLVQIQQLSW
jgi:hypothetical protein